MSMASLAFGQGTTVNLQDYVQSSASGLATLERLSADCVTAVRAAQAGRGQSTNSGCVALSDALEAGLLVDYLSDCRVLTNWRNRFVFENSADAESGLPEVGIDSNVEDARELLQLMKDIERLCGDLALNFNASSFSAALPYTRAAAQADSAALSGTSLGNQQQQILRAQGNELQQRISGQDSRRTRETQRQFDALELELIRQQLRRNQ